MYQETTYTPQGNICRIFEAHDKELLVEGPVRTGKTRGILEKCYLCAAKYPKSRILWIRKTKESIVESVLQTFEDHVLPKNHYLLDGASRSHRVKYPFRNGSEIVIGGMDKPSKILSSEYDIICAFEATELEIEDWETIITRANNSVIPYNQCIADCNPAHPQHWLNQRAIGQSIFRITTELKDNPKFWDLKRQEWTEAGNALLDKLSHLTGPRRDRLVRGLWVAAEGLIYDSWDSGIFVTAEPFSPITVIAGVDKGYPNPSAIIVLGADSDGKIRVLDEFYRGSVLDVDLITEAKRLKDKYKIEYFMVDPSCSELIAKFKYNNLAAMPANNAVQPGINCVASYLRILGDGKSAITISPACRNLIDEFSAYRWNDHTTKEEPVKENDHALDALRYGLMQIDRFNNLSRSPAHIDISDKDEYKISDEAIAGEQLAIRGANDLKEEMESIGLWK